MESWEDAINNLRGRLLKTSGSALGTCRRSMQYREARSKKQASYRHDKTLIDTGNEKLLSSPWIKVIRVRGWIETEGICCQVWFANIILHSSQNQHLKIPWRSWKRRTKDVGIGVHFHVYPTWERPWQCRVEDHSMRNLEHFIDLCSCCFI